MLEERLVSEQEARSQEQREHVRQMKALEEDNLQQQQAFNLGFDRGHMEEGLRLFLNWRNRKLFNDNRMLGVARGRSVDNDRLGLAVS